MRARRHVPFVPGFSASALVALACSAPERPVTPVIDAAAGGGVTQITDATGGGEPHFYWLPPIAPARTYPGTFDGTLTPELRVCRLTGDTCETTIATYTLSSSPAIAVSSSQQSYALEWSTKPASITNGDYRAEVLVNGRRFGVADARVATNAKDLKTVPAGFVGVQKGKSLVFAFRLEHGIVGSIAITPNKPTIEIGATQQLTATVRDLHDAVIAGAPVVWATSNPAIATVSASGLVTGVAEDTLIVSATSGTVFANDTVAIVRARVAQVVVEPSDTSVNVGQSASLTATTYDARGAVLTGRLVSWSSSDAAVATVSSAGVVTGLAPGSVNVFATSEGASGSAAVAVTEVPVSHVAVTPQFASLSVGQSAPFTATAFDAANNPLPGRAITWESGDTAVIRVAPNGVVTAAGPGLMWASAIASTGFGDSATVEVTGATVSCLRPWALPQLWFISNPYGRAIRARYGTPNEFRVIPPATISGNYYPLALGEQSSARYISNVVACTAPPVTLGAPNPLFLGNAVAQTLVALDSLFELDRGAIWDSTANGGLGAIVNSNAPPGSESARVVLVGLYDDRDHAPGDIAVRFRRTAYVFVDTYSRTTNFDTNEVKGDIVFRFLRFGP
jgi:uncharacterized protein YjdB